MNTCSVYKCGRPALKDSEFCSQCDAEFKDYMRRRTQAPTYAPANLAEIDRTTPGQHNLKLDMAKELKPITAIENDWIPKSPQEVKEALQRQLDAINEELKESLFPMTAEETATAFTVDFDPSLPKPPAKKIQASLAQKYPAYYKSVQDYDYIDAYAVHHLFAIQDNSGMLQHASKKLLLSGVRSGNKSKYKDIKEARDTLNRWLELNPED